MNDAYVKAVAERIIEQLQQGTAPWQRAWAPGEQAIPYNALTERPYRGMNLLWLQVQGYADPRWLTFRQAGEAGAQVRKGEHGTRIVYWKFHDERPVVNEAGAPVRDAEGRPQTAQIALERPRFFHAVVFNAEQIEGLPPLTRAAVRPEPERHARAEALLAHSGAQIRHLEGAHPMYSPVRDVITLPPIQDFTSPADYYVTALHELGHWTGHPSRLDRDMAHPFGSKEYAREELRAEIASYMLGSRLELGYDPGQHAAYVANWITVLQQDPREIFRASADAEKISGYVLAFEKEKARAVTLASAIEIEQIEREDTAHLAAPIAAATTRPTDPRPALQRLVDHAGWTWASDPTNPLDTPAVKQLFFGVGARGVIAPQGERRLFITARPDASLALTVGPEELVRVEQGDPHDVARALQAHVDQYVTAQRQARGWTLAPQAADNAETSVSVTPERSTMSSPPRRYLTIPFAKKEEAKALATAAGFKIVFDGARRQWHATSDVDLTTTALAQWLPENLPSPTAAFTVAIHELGLLLEGEPQMDGRIHRVKVHGDKGAERSGAYAGHKKEGEHPGGYIENFKTGDQLNWKYEGPVERVTLETHQQLLQEAKAQAAQRDAEHTRKYERAAARAQALWAEAIPATAQHPYCIKKGITQPGEHGLRVVPAAVSSAAHLAGIRIAASVKDAKAQRQAHPDAFVYIAGDLLVPLRDAAGELWSLQMINPSFKGFTRDAKRAGVYSVAGINPDAYPAYLTAQPSTPIILAEGHATADTVARLLGQPVIAVGGWTNYQSVAQQVRATWPERAIIFAADNDHRSDANVGRSKATEIAKTVHGAVVAPPDHTGTDWNDYALQYGDDAAKLELQVQVAHALAAAVITKERLLTVERAREANAHDDPTTSADDLVVARERAAAHDLMGRAIAGEAEVSREAIQALARGGGASTLVAEMHMHNVEQAAVLSEQRTAAAEGATEISQAQRVAPDRTTEKPVARPRRGQGIGL